MSDDLLNFARNNPRVVAQVLLSLVALASPLHSVWLTLSRATLNTLALVLVLNIVVHLLALPAEKKPRCQSTPDMRLAAQTRAASTRQTNTSNAAHAASYRELASDMFGTAALPHDAPFADFKRRHELAARRLLPQLFA